jgi:hypothetical protein
VTLLALLRRTRLGALGAVFFVVAAVLPLAFGPALERLAFALTGEAEHACACGMKPGTCGCPRCERLAGADVTPAPTATLSSCDNHGKGALGARLPPCVFASGFVVAEAPAAGVLETTLVATARPRGPDAPPTRPPRRDVA